MFNTLDSQYQQLLRDVIAFGTDKKDRTGTGTRSVFSREIRHDMRDGFPILTTKKVPFKTMCHELDWFLKGDTNISYLVNKNCHIWDGDAYKYYRWRTRQWDDLEFEDGVHIMSRDEFIKKVAEDSEFAAEFADLGPIYGHQWRHWGAGCASGDATGLGLKRHSGIDQIKNLIEMLKEDPDSRRLLVSAWNVGDLSKMWLPPCHFGFQVWTRELNLDERIAIYNGSRVPGSRSSDYFHEHMDDYGIPRRAISLKWYQRSADVFLGVPFNISSYGLLLEIIAQEVNMVPEELIGSFGDVHLYNNHIDQAKEQIKRTQFKLPTLKLHHNASTLTFNSSHAELKNYNCHPPIKAPLSN